MLAISFEISLKNNEQVMPKHFQTQIYSLNSLRIQIQSIRFFTIHTLSLSLSLLSVKYISFGTVGNCAQFNAFWPWGSYHSYNASGVNRCIIMSALARMEPDTLEHLFVKYKNKKKNHRNTMLATDSIRTVLI